MESIKGLRDNPIENKKEEKLGLTDYADSLSDFILICDTPITIAIQGDWGSGKTSMMNMISDTIKESTICIPFNSWQFSQFDLESYLHVTLLNQFLEKIGATETIKDFTSKVGRWMTKVAKTALVATADKALGGAAAGAIKDEMFAGDPTEIIKEIANLKQKVQEVLIKRLKEEGKDRAVVFIDDLDRLAPEKAVELLEVLKIFLDIDKCVFVLAVDYKVVSQGLKKKFGEDVGSMKGKSFFDKIIQLPFNMPVSRYDADKYIIGILKSLNISFHPDDVKEYRNLIESSIGFNPRSIKRLFNSFLLILSVARKKNLFEESKQATLEERLRLLFGIQCMQTAWEDLYYFIIKNSDKLSDEFLQGLKDEKRFQSEAVYNTLMGKISPEDIFKMTDFMGVFYNTMQLKSDSNVAISQQEIWNLIELVQFSSITSRDSSIVQESAPTDYNWDLVKSIAVSIARKLGVHFNIKLDKYPGLRSEFWFWPERWGVNNQHEKFRVFIKFFRGSSILLDFNFFLEEGIVVFKVDSNKIKLKKSILEIIQNCGLSGAVGYQYNEAINEFLILWKKPVPGYSDATVGNKIFEYIKIDLDQILPMLLEKIHHLLPENPVRVKFINNLKNKVFNKLQSGQLWAMVNNHIEGQGIRINIEPFEPDGTDSDGGYGCWWGVYDLLTNKGIPFGLPSSSWEGIKINGVDDFKDFLDGNQELERLEQSPELMEKVLESISDDIVQKVKVGLASMSRPSDQN